MASVSDLRGGAQYPEPFKSIIGAFDFISLDLYSVFHLECLFGSANYMANLLVASLWPVLALMVNFSVVSKNLSPVPSIPHCASTTSFVPPPNLVP